MSLRPDGSYRCDRCDRDVGNGDVQTSATVLTVELVDAGGGITAPVPVRFDFCTEPRPEFPHGCTGRILTARNLTAYRASKESPG